MRAALNSRNSRKAWQSGPRVDPAACGVVGRGEAVQGTAHRVLAAHRCHHQNQKEMDHDGLRLRT